MGITRISAITMQAEMFGRVVDVTYENEVLYIRGVTLDESLTVLETMALRSLVTVALPATKQAPRQKVKEQAPEPAQSLEAAKVGAVQPSPAAQPVQASEAVVLSESAAASQPTTEQHTAHEPAPAKPKEAKKARPLAIQEPSPEPPPAPSSAALAPATASTPAIVAAVDPLPAQHPDSPTVVRTSSDQPPAAVDITGAKQLKDVVSMLHEHFGISDPDAMVAKCMELRPTVPVLGRITAETLGNRVKRCMELLPAAGA